MGGMPSTELDVCITVHKSICTITCMWLPLTLTTAVEWSVVGSVLNATWWNEVIWFQYLVGWLRMKWYCIDFKCVREPTKSRLSLTYAPCKQIQPLSRIRALKMVREFMRYRQSELQHLFQFFYLWLWSLNTSTAVLHIPGCWFTHVKQFASNVLSYSAISNHLPVDVWRRLVPKMTCYVSSGTLNLTRLKLSLKTFLQRWSIDGYRVISTLLSWIVYHYDRKIVRDQYSIFEIASL